MSKRKTTNANIEDKLVKGTLIRKFEINFLHHFVYGAAIAMFFFIIANSLYEIEYNIAALIGVTAAHVVGLGKELYDKFIKKTWFDWYDFVWTIIGSACPFGLVTAWDVFLK